MDSSSSFFFYTAIVFFALIFVVASSEFRTPYFEASNLLFIDDHGAFLYSSNGTFKAAMYNPGNQQNRFYLCVIHVASNTIIWSANRDAPVSDSGKMKLSSDGMVISDQNGNPRWSTPELHSPVSALALTDAGNLVLLDQNNVSIWDSFRHPTDTIVIGQELPVGTSLFSSVSPDYLSIGGYSLSITTSDAIMQWEESTYWKLSMDANVYRNSNYAVEYLALDGKGLHLFGSNGSVVVLQVNLSPDVFRIAKLDSDGRFVVSSYSGDVWKQEFVGPRDICGIPIICGKVGLCTISTAASNDLSCKCPSGFHSDPQQSNGCVPRDSSFSLPVACDSSNHSDPVKNPGNISFLELAPGEGYFAITFSDPLKMGINPSDCQDLCTADCSCLGFFYVNSSGSCYVVRDQLGSIMSSSGVGNTLGYVKTMVAALDPTNPANKRSNNRRSTVAWVVFPFSGLVVTVALGFFGWRKWRSSKVGLEKSNHLSSASSREMEAFSIPGLPVRYDYDVLKSATDNFRNQIGSGGFGSVYKGILPDEAIVAVKKITNLGVQGKKEFCTEIAIIGNIHHVNLVKLKGFCAQGNQRLLVYEYMNRGSLDRTLFGSGPVLEWQERFDIALGTARGLAYLHSGCDHKIIHCDVKPENILLHDNFQAKISDFGLSKLLNPEQSSHFTTMRGTRGYLAPEWLTSSAVSEKTDVYSYGMVLLELVSGRKNCSWRQQTHSLDEDNNSSPVNNSSSTSSGSGLIYFPLLALEMHEQGRYLELADPRLEGRVTGEEVEKLVRIALCCVHEEPALRPSMLTIVGMLEGRIPLGYPRLESLNFLRFYGRRVSEASVVAEGQQMSDFAVYQQNELVGGGVGYISYSYGSSQQLSGPREANEEYAKYLKGVAEKLLRCLSKGLGLKEEALKEGGGGEDMMYLLKINFYPPCPRPDLALGVPPHTDMSLLTILVPNDVPGLQVCRHGLWYDVKYIPNALIIHIGDQIEIMSNGKYKAVLHRTTVNKDRTRMSWPVFIEPPSDHALGPIPELVSEENPAKYKTKKYGDYKYCKLNKLPQ